MSRTTRDIFIRDKTVDELKAVVLEWFRKNRVKVLGNTSDYVFGRWGRGILTAAKFFEVTFVLQDGGVLVKTEGWIAGVTGLPYAIVYLPIQDFSDTARTYGGIPRKEGMKAIKRLWSTLESLSKNP